MALRLLVEKLGDCKRRYDFGKPKAQPERLRSRDQSRRSVCGIGRVLSAQARFALQRQKLPLKAADVGIRNNAMKVIGSFSIDVRGFQAHLPAGHAAAIWRYEVGYARMLAAIHP